MNDEFTVSISDKAGVRHLPDHLYGETTILGCLWFGIIRPQLCSTRGMRFHIRDLLTTTIESRSPRQKFRINSAEQNISVRHSQNMKTKLIVETMVPILTATLTGHGLCNENVVLVVCDSRPAVV